MTSAVTLPVRQLEIELINLYETQEKLYNPKSDPTEVYLEFQDTLQRIDLLKTHIIPPIDQLKFNDHLITCIDISNQINTCYDDYIVNSIEAIYSEATSLEKNSNSLSDILPTCKRIDKCIKNIIKTKPGVILNQKIEAATKIINRLVQETSNSPDSNATYNCSTSSFYPSSSSNSSSYCTSSLTSSFYPNSLNSSSSHTISSSISSFYPSSSNSSLNSYVPDSSKMSKLSVSLPSKLMIEIPKSLGLKITRIENRSSKILSLETRKPGHDTGDLELQETLKKSAEEAFERDLLTISLLSLQDSTSTSSSS